MSSGLIAGTFTTGSVGAAGATSDSLLVRAGTTTVKLTTTGVNASNTIKTRKRTSPGGAWADQTTYSTEQAATPIAVVAGEEWQLVSVTQQPITDVRFKLSAES